MKYGWILSVSLAALTFAGCGSKADTPAANVPSAPASGTPEAAAQTTKVEAPDAVVSAFLESLRAGNDTMAAALLTDLARQETTKKGLKVQPPGTPDMTYQIGQTEFVTEAKDGAHVGSVWSEKLPTGETASFEVIWVLRREPQGWRIAGMATPVGDDSQPLFLNFEDPDDLLQKWQASETEMVESDPGEAPAGQVPAAEGQFPAEQPGGQFAAPPQQQVPAGQFQGGQFPENNTPQNTANQGGFNPLR